MCYNTKLNSQSWEILQRFDAQDVRQPELFEPKVLHNGFANPFLPVITNAEPELISMYQWGLIPHWAKDPSIQKYTLNAKSETLGEKPSFRSNIKKRCLVIVNGFYEWQWQDAKGKKKQKHLISLKDEAIFTLGGLWNHWQDKNTEKKVHSFTIVTTAANDLMAQIHNTKKRMPIVLDRYSEQRWLSNRPVKEFDMTKLELVAEHVN